MYIAWCLQTAVSPSAPASPGVTDPAQTQPGVAKKFARGDTGRVEREEPGADCLGRTSVWWERLLSDNFTLLATQDTGEYAAEVMLQNAFKYYVSLKWQVGLMAELL